MQRAADGDGTGHPAEDAKAMMCDPAAAVVGASVHSCRAGRARCGSRAYTLQVPFARTGKPAGVRRRCASGKQASQMVVLDSRAMGSGDRGACWCRLVPMFSSMFSVVFLLADSRSYGLLAVAGPGQNETGACMLLCSYCTEGRCCGPCDALVSRTLLSRRD